MWSHAAIASAKGILLPAAGLITPGPAKPISHFAHIGNFGVDRIETARVSGQSSDTHEKIVFQFRPRPTCSCVVSIANLSSQTTINTTQSNGRYRPEIDGLRAFAVIAVIINHFSKDILPSGYLGVDLFFVISGYVLTSSLAGKRSKGFGDFISGFYERRIKRLVPALVVFVLITSVLISLFNPAPETALKTGIASLFGISNIYLIAKSTDYFAQATELNPFTHTWFLGVQEQFCIVFLILLWLTGFSRQVKNSTTKFFFLISALATASLASFLYLYQTNQPVAYFSMPTRFWEMAAGCLMFIALQKKGNIQRVFEKISPLAILAAMTGLMFLPISAAVPATILTVLLSAILIASLRQGTSSFAILTNPKVYYIGLISYSLYLWHWGILSISRWTIGVHLQSFPFQLIAIVGIAALSYKYVETPLRKRAWFQARWMTLLGGLLILVISGLTGLKLSENWHNALYLGIRNQASIPQDNNGINDKDCPSDNELEDSQLLTQCVLESRNGKTIIAVGDSQTGHLLPLLNKLNSDKGFGVRYYSSAGVGFPSLLETRNIGGGSIEKFKERHQRINEVFQTYMRNARAGDTIILSSRHELRWGDYPVPLSQRDTKFTFYNDEGDRIDQKIAFEKWKSLVDEISLAAKAKGLNVIIFNSIPTFPDPLPDSVENPQWFNTWANQKYRKLSRNELIDNYSNVDNYFKELSGKYPNTHVFDIFSAVCPAGEVYCSADGYHDQWHLTDKGILKAYPSFITLLNSKILANTTNNGS